MLEGCWLTTCKRQTIFSPGESVAVGGSPYGTGWPEVWLWVVRRQTVMVARHGRVTVLCWIQSLALHEAFSTLGPKSSSLSVVSEESKLLFSTSIKDLRIESHCLVGSCVHLWYRKIMSWIMSPFLAYEEGFGYPQVTGTESGEE
ncbi:uncharacterized protein LOC115838234 [Nomascus leucogenys]|uniref:uncharacterized protein LOC115838234 n=1 Tax=Nomascus leucogenys TaxID=61853 RepID=UPI00122D9573|nr:uncharacterized protein LOC115838234 [Nomascus leucogenys]